jgi:hypothetical protein
VAGERVASDGPDAVERDLVGVNGPGDGGVVDLAVLVAGGLMVLLLEGGVLVSWAALLLDGDGLVA